MSDEIGGNSTSSVPNGNTGTSAVSGADPDGATTRPCVVNTSAGAWMTPIVGGVVVVSLSRSSSDREKPYATNAAATTTPTVVAMRVVRDRRFDSIDSTTTATLSR
jgi:hypothetical protein